jgi:hypothetical protein
MLCRLGRLVFLKSNNASVAAQLRIPTSMFALHSVRPDLSLLLCYAMLCYAMLRYATLCYAMLCYAMLCYAMLRYAMLCYAMLC